MLQWKWAKNSLLYSFDFIFLKKVEHAAASSTLNLLITSILLQVHSPNFGCKIFTSFFSSASMSSSPWEKEISSVSLELCRWRPQLTPAPKSINVFSLIVVVDVVVESVNEFPRCLLFQLFFRVSMSSVTSTQHSFSYHFLGHSFQVRRPSEPCEEVEEWDWEVAPVTGLSISIKNCLKIFHDVHTVVIQILCSPTDKHAYEWWKNKIFFHDLKIISYVIVMPSWGQ